MLDDKTQHAVDTIPGTPSTPAKTKRGWRWTLWTIPIGVLAIIGTLRMLEAAAQRHNARVRANMSDRRSMKSIEIAIKGYQTEYNRYPLAAEHADETPIYSEGKILKILMAEDGEHNPRKIRFLDPQPARQGKSGYLVDETGAPKWIDSQEKPYRIIIDYDGDGEIKNPHSTGKPDLENISAGLIVWSGGMDGNIDTCEDNVTNWQ